MKTIVEGNLEVTKEYKYFECLICGWVGKADKTEYIYCGDQKEVDYWSVKCPCCKHKAYDIPPGNKLNQIIDKEIKMDNMKSLDYIEELEDFLMKAYEKI